MPKNKNADVYIKDTIPTTKTNKPSSMSLSPCNCESKQYKQMISDITNITPKGIEPVVIPIKQHNVKILIISSNLFSPPSVLLMLFSKQRFNLF